MGLLCRALDASSGPHLLLRLFALLCAIHRLPISAASALLSTGREDREALRAKEYCEALGCYGAISSSSDPVWVSVVEAICSRLDSSSS